MTLDRPALKRRAKETIATSKPSVVAVGVVYLMLGIIINMLSARLMGLNISQSEITNYMTYFSEGNYDAALQYIDRMQPSGGAHAIDLLLTIVRSVVEAGFIIFLLNTIRATQPCFGNLLDGFGFFFKIIVLNFLMALFIILWSFLLFVPGIIAALSYSQAIYILVDDPTKSAMQCLRESKALMRGHKWELFKLQFSFFGWALLASLPTVGYAVQVWTIPYTSMTYALYYEKLVGNYGYEEPVYSY
ncbi:MAG: DUF975 family protein [Oscillospiraceae bacterium]|nr:DUF975 family protein [Oscillospiraceae bacterium]